MNHAAIRNILVARMQLAEAETEDARADRAEAEAVALDRSEAAIDARYDAATRARIVGIAAACCGALGSGVGAVEFGLTKLDVVDEPGLGDVAGRIGGVASGGLQAAFGPTGAADEAGTEASIAEEEANLARADVHAVEARAAQSEERLRRILLTRA